MSFFFFFFGPGEMHCVSANGHAAGMDAPAKIS